MKKHIITLLSAVLTLTTCTLLPEKDIKNSTDENATITITAHQEGYNETKTLVVDGDMQVYWEPGDEIKLFCYDESGKFTSQNNDNAALAEFKGPDILKKGNTIWGLYPYRDDASSDGESVTTVLSDVQKGRTGSFSRNTHITLAKSNSFDMGFYNVTGGLRFTLINEGVKSVTLESKNGEPIVGKAKIIFKDGVPAIEDVIEGKSKITLIAPDAGTFETGKWYYIVTLPSTLTGGFKLLFNRSLDRADRSTTNAVTFSRGSFLSIDGIDEGVVFSSIPTAVDLGLSVKWADRNVGAESTEDGGDYFAWGETEAKGSYCWSTYKYCNGSRSTLTRYCDNSSCGYNGFTDNMTVLNLDDDVAYAIFGDGYHMPTDADWTELRNNCIWTWTTLSGVKGYKVTSKTNGNSIFLPAAGCRADSSLLYLGDYGRYWSSSLSTSIPEYAWNVYFASDGVERRYQHRCYGFSIRPVYGGDDRVESISLSSLSFALVEGDSRQLTATVLPIYTTNTAMTWFSDDPSIAEVSSEGLVTAVNAGMATITVRTKDGNHTASCAVIVLSSQQHELIDLGLSVRWRDRNLGASSPEGYGDYYAWGEINTKSNYNWSTYKYCNGNDKKLTKYCSESSYGYNGFTDNKTVLDVSDDAASSNLGGSWRIPTNAEWSELRTNCIWTWSTYNGTNGYWVTSKSNGKSIFLPAAGYGKGKEINCANSDGFYWSSSLYLATPAYAWLLTFYSSSVGRNHNFYRSNGQSVRPVKD